MCISSDLTGSGCSTILSDFDLVHGNRICSWILSGGGKDDEKTNHDERINEPEAPIIFGGLSEFLFGTGG